MRRHLTRIASLIAALTLVGGIVASSASAYAIGSWTGVTYTPTCEGAYYGLWATCFGEGAIVSIPPSYPEAWAQMEVCDSQLLSSGWNNFNCNWVPDSPQFTNFIGDETPGFTLAACNRWYTTYVFGKVLLVGGWYENSGRAPGIQARC